MADSDFQHMLNSVSNSNVACEDSARSDVAQSSVNGLPVDELVDLLICGTDYRQPLRFRLIPDECGNSLRRQYIAPDPAASLAKLHAALAHMPYLSHHRPQFHYVPNSCGIHREYLDPDHAMSWSKMWAAGTHLRYLYNNPGECIVPSDFGAPFSLRCLKDVDDGPWMGFHAYSTDPDAVRLRANHPVFAAIVRAILEGRPLRHDVVDVGVLEQHNDPAHVTVIADTSVKEDKDKDEEGSDIAMSYGDAPPEAVQDAVVIDKQDDPTDVLTSAGTEGNDEGIGMIVTTRPVLLPNLVPSPPLPPAHLESGLPTPDSTPDIPSSVPTSGFIPTAGEPDVTRSKPPPLSAPSASATPVRHDVSPHIEEPPAQHSVPESSGSSADRSSLRSSLCASSQPSPGGDDDPPAIKELPSQQLRRSRLSTPFESESDSDVESTDAKSPPPSKKRSRPNEYAGVHTRRHSGNLAGFVVSDDNIEYESEATSTTDNDHDSDTSTSPPPQPSRRSHRPGDRVSGQMRPATKNRPRSPSSSSRAESEGRASDMFQQIVKKPRTGMERELLEPEVDMPASRKRGPSSPRSDLKSDQTRCGTRPTSFSGLVRSGFSSQTRQGVHKSHSAGFIPEPAASGSRKRPRASVSPDRRSEQTTGRGIRPPSFSGPIRSGASSHTRQRVHKPRSAGFIPDEHDPAARRIISSKRAPASTSQTPQPSHATPVESYIPRLNNEIVQLLGAKYRLPSS